MSWLVPLKPREVDKILCVHGFVLNHTTGSHKQYFHPKTKKHVTVPFHSKTIAKGTLQSIIRQSGLDSNIFKR